MTGSRHYRRCNVIAAFFVGALVNAPGLSQAQASASDDLAERVSRLRAEVDTLAHRLETERRRARDALASLRVERADLQRQIRLEQVRRATLRRLTREREERSQTLETEAEMLVAPLLRSVRAVDAYVDRGLPFRIEARRRRLRALETELTGLQPDPARVLRQLWRFVEEEEALTREVGYSRQAVLLGGQRQLVEVARIGMALLYLRSADDRVGMARRDGDGAWSFTLLDEPTARQAVRALLSDLQGNRRLGPKRLLVPESLAQESREAF